MNTFNFNDKTFMSTNTYKEFIKDNPLIANLNIRTSAASSAIPISNVKIIVSKMIDGNKIIFYNGITDDSGMINNIKLPTPAITDNDLDAPQGTLYDIEAIYEKDNIDRFYKVLMYPDICVVQNINIVPTMEVIDYGS